MKITYPIIHIIGLPGAEKTILAKKLSLKIGLPVIEIEECRKQFPNDRKTFFVKTNIKNY